MLRARSVPVPFVESVIGAASTRSGDTPASGMSSTATPVRVVETMVSSTFSSPPNLGKSVPS